MVHQVSPGIDITEADSAIVPHLANPLASIGAVEVIAEPAGRLLAHTRLKRFGGEDYQTAHGAHVEPMRLQADCAGTAASQKSGLPVSFAEVLLEMPVRMHRFRGRCRQ